MFLQIKSMLEDTPSSNAATSFQTFQVILLVVINLMVKSPLASNPDLNLASFLYHSLNKEQLHVKTLLRSFLAAKLLSQGFGNERTA